MSSIVPGATLASKYELIEIAGQGGMATVWRARMLGAGGFSRPVAIKLMHSRLSGDRHFVDLFVEEARVCSQIQHPNVVQILDFGEQEGTYFLAIEWVDGLDLLEYSRAFSKHGFFVPWMALVTIGVEVLKGMGAAHDHINEQGQRSPIIHRDITPHNILLGVNGLVKLTDFGLAKATDRGSMTLPHVLKGKLSYTAPEMTHGVKANERTDLFSLGVTLWEALAGRKMFDAPSPLQIVRQIQAWKVPPLDSLRSDLPPELVRVVSKATARAPEDRYGSTQEMALALSRLLPPLPDLQRLGRSVVEARQRKNTELTEEQFQELSTELSSPLSPLSAAAPNFSLAPPAQSAARAARLQPRPAAGQHAASPPASQHTTSPPAGQHTTSPPAHAASQPAPRMIASEPPVPRRPQSNTAQRHTGMQPHGSTPKTPAVAPIEPGASQPPTTAHGATQPPQQGASARSTTQPPQVAPTPSARSTTRPPQVAQSTPARSTTQQPPTQGAARSTTQQPPTQGAARSTTQQPATIGASSPTQDAAARAAGQPTGQPASVGSSQDEFSVLFEAPPSSTGRKETPAVTPAPPARVEPISINALIDSSLADFSIEVTVGSSVMDLSSLESGPGAIGLTPPPRGVAPTVLDPTLWGSTAPPPGSEVATDPAPPPMFPAPSVPAAPAPQESIQEISTLFDLQDIAPAPATTRPPRPPPPPPPRRRG
jgi:serine/threonine-protein kinase